MTKSKHDIYVGDCLEKMRTLPDNSVDVIITDPPYGLSAPPDIEEVLSKWEEGEKYEHTSKGFMGACVHPHTEVLTPSGFRLVKEMEIGDLCYALNPESNTIEVVPVVASHAYEYEGPLVHVKGRSIEQMVTPNHRLFLGKPNQKWELKEAQLYRPNVFYQRNQGHWEGLEEDWIAIGDKKYPSVAFFRFLGLFLGDGYTVNRKAQPWKQDFFGFAVLKERKKKCIRESLAEMRVDFSENEGKDQKSTFYVYDKTLLRYLKPLGKAAEKYIPKDLFRYAPSFLELLYSGLIDTDGCVQGYNGQHVFGTSSQLLAEDFQHLCFLTGRSCVLQRRNELTQAPGEVAPSMHISWRASVTQSGKTFYLEKVNHKNPDNRNWQEVEYQGSVHCITLEKHHIMLTRLNGRTVWTGNSWDSHVPGPTVWKEAYRVLKPGAMAAVFAGTRTLDLMQVAVEMAGFEVLDHGRWLYGCLSDDTECLTKEGWVLHTELDEDTEVMQWDSATGTLSWTTPTKVHRYPYEGELVNLRNRHMDQLLTPNHRVYAKIRKHSREPSPDEYTVVEAGDLRAHWHVSVPMAGRLEEGQGPGPEKAYLIGWWLTDAWVHGDGKVCMFSQSKPDTLRKLTAALAPYLPSEYVKEGKKDTHNDEHTFYVPGDLSDYLLSNHPERELGWWCLGWDYESRLALYRGLMDGDGSLPSKQHAHTFWSQNQERRDVFVALCVSLGMRAYGDDGAKGCVYVNTKTSTSQLQHKHRKAAPSVPYKGIVWCLTVPTGAFVARRGEKPFITGNSGFPKSHDVSKALDKMKDNRDEILQVTAWIAKARDDANLSNKDIDDAFGFNGMAGHWTSKGTQPSVPTLEQIPHLLRVLRVEEVPDEIRVLLLDLNASKGQPSPNWFKREVVGEHTQPLTKGDSGIYAWNDKGEGKTQVDITAPATEEAERWTGYGTALKPSVEPVILLWKPDGGTPPTPPFDFHYCAKASGKERYFHCSVCDTVHPKKDRKKHGKDVEGHDKDSITMHPTQKPLGIMEELVRRMAKPGAVVMDPFTGSGTTAVAAIEHGCSFVGADIHVEHVKIANHRVGLIEPPKPVGGLLSMFGVK